MNPINAAKAVLHRVGFALRESGQALERVGCRLQGNYSFEEKCEHALDVMQLGLIVLLGNSRPSTLGLFFSEPAHAGNASGLSGPLCPKVVLGSPLGSRLGRCQAGRGELGLVWSCRAR